MMEWVELWFLCSLCTGFRGILKGNLLSMSVIAMARKFMIYLHSTLL